MDIDHKKIFATNLRKYMDIKEVDRNKLANHLGVAYTTVNEWYSGVSYPRVNKILELANFLGITIIDLLESDGSNIKDGIPVFGRIPAGTPIEVLQETFDYDRVKAPRHWHINDNNYFGLILSGDSMEPKYSDGDVVLFKKDDDNYSGKDCCIMIDNTDATFKRVTKNDRGLLIEPLNIHNSSNYLPEQLSLEECEARNLRILGVAVYHYSKIKN